MPEQHDKSEPPVTSADQPWTISRLIGWTTAHFAEAELDAPRLATELLLAHAMGCQRIELYTRYEQVPPEEQLADFRDMVRRAAHHEPIAYLIARKDFYSLEFEVTPAVLIPRPETEVLVEEVIHHCRSLDQPRIDVLDLGTGSGCVGLALCNQVDQIFAIGSDISEQALEIARRNAEKLGLSERFRTVQADCLDLPADAVPQAGFDVLVSNPPYVAADDVESLSENVRAHEPHLALFAGSDGLDFYRRIADSAAGMLKPGASLFVEIGYDQHDGVVKIMTAADFRHVQSWRDFVEGHLRVIRFDQKK